MWLRTNEFPFFDSSFPVGIHFTLFTWRSVAVKEGRCQPACRAARKYILCILFFYRISENRIRPNDVCRQAVGKNVPRRRSCSAFIFCMSHRIVITRRSAFALSPSTTPSSNSIFSICHELMVGFIFPCVLRYESP